MSGLFSITVQTAKGQVATSADIDGLAVVIGIASALGGTTALPTPQLTPFYLNGAVAKAAAGYGDAVDTLCQIIEQRQGSDNPSKKPCCLYAVPSDTPASYGAVDDDLETGTAVVTVDAAVLPFGNYEGYFRCTKAGLIGTPGIEFVHSLDDGRNVSPITALGSASSFTIPDGNVKFVFNPTSANLTTLDTLIDNLFTELLAHFVYTTGGVHGAADTTQETYLNASTFPAATSTATRVARINACAHAYAVHRITTASAVHIGVDSTDVVTALLATDDVSALTLALNLKAMFAAHEANTTVHTVADATNLVTAPNPTAGSLNVGDIIRVRTAGPKPSLAAIDAAFIALAKASLQVAIVVCEFDCDSTMAAHLSTGRGVMEAAGKDVAILFRTRVPDAENAETETAWGASIIADFHDFTDESLIADATYGLLTDAMTTRQYKRSDLAQFAADVVRVKRADMPDVPADRAEANFKLIDSKGITVGHDEGPRGNFTGLSDATQGNRFRSTMRFPDPSRLESVYTTIPWTMYAVDDRIRNLPTLRICNAMKRIARAEGTSALGGRLRYNPATDTTPAQLTYAAQLAVHKVLFSKISTEFKDDIQNPMDAALNGLVQVNPIVTVHDGNVLDVEVTLAPLVFGYLQNLKVILSVQQ
jgi:hypothetical protein